jgi:DNA-binding protein YbaB
MFDKFSQIGSKGAAGVKLAMLQRKIMGKKIEVEKGDIKVVVTGDGKLKTIFVDGSERKEIVEAVNEAIGQAQKWAATEMQGMMGEISKFLK